VFPGTELPVDPYVKETGPTMSALSVKSVPLTLAWMAAFFLTGMGVTPRNGQNCTLRAGLLRVDG
jgi:hypothetical protein